MAKHLVSYAFNTYAVGVGKLVNEAPESPVDAPGSVTSGAGIDGWRRGGYAHHARRERSPLQLTIQLAVLGLVAGAAYGLAAVGLITICKGSGVLNFAHGGDGDGGDLRLRQSGHRRR